MHPNDVRKKWLYREIPLYGRNQVNGDLSWRLTGLLFSVCFSCHEIQFPELKRLLCRSAPSWGGAIIKPFKFSFVFWRDSGNSPGARAYFALLIPGFEQFPFFFPCSGLRFQKALFSRRFSMCTHHVKSTGAELQSEACE